jgi:uncharacterized alkaline shock family protein YloU
MEKMEEYSKTQGRTTIDPGVLIKIAKLTALSVPGVRKMASGPHHVFERIIQMGFVLMLKTILYMLTCILFLAKM